MPEPLMIVFIPRNWLHLSIRKAAAAAEAPSPSGGLRHCDRSVGGALFLIDVLWRGATDVSVAFFSASCYGTAFFHAGFLSPKIAEEYRCTLLTVVISGSSSTAT